MFIRSPNHIFEAFIRIKGFSVITSSSFECFGCIDVFLVFGTELVQCFNATLGYHFPVSASFR